MADLTGEILVCKRPWVELDPHESERSTLVKCSSCGCDVYAMKKNLGRGLVILCYPCARTAAFEGVKKGEPCLLMQGDVIGSEHEDEIHAEVKKLEEKLKNEN